MGVLCTQTERCCISVVLLVNVLVENTVVEQTVSPVMPAVLQDEEQGPLEEHGFQFREWNCHLNSDTLTKRMERPYWGGLKPHVVSENGLETLPLLLVRRNVCGLELPLSEVRRLVNDVPWETSSKVPELVCEEEQETRCQRVVLHVGVPGGPQFLKHIKLCLCRKDVFGNLNQAGRGQLLQSGGVENLGHF